jgi:hypothetical protein
MLASTPARSLFIALSLAAACAATAAAAETNIIVTRTLPPGMKVSGAEFNVDERTGSARLVVDVYDDSWEGNLFSDAVVVPGLRFDRERREVLYDTGGAVVTCARPRKVLWSTSYPATGACRIVVRSEPRKAGGDPGEARAWTDWRDWVVELVTDEPAKTAARSR